MTQPFPDNVFLRGPMGPSGVECDAPDLVIQGELPADLEGVYFRNGPDPLYPPRDGDEYHWFHGDGMIQRFEFAAGRVSWRNRWVRTEKYALERAAGESLFGVLGNPLKADPAVASEHYNTANTHVVWHGGRLLALMEGTIAVELQADTLDTVGNFDFDGQVDGPITAHPKFDHATGEMIFFGNQARGPFSEFLRLNIADRDGRLVKSEMIQAPFPSFAHDFFVTEHYVVFPVYPLVFSLERAMKGGLPMAWEPERGAHFGVLPRNGSAADVQWFDMEARWSFHMVNAWEDNGVIKVDVCASNGTNFAPMADGRMADPAIGLQPRLRRWTIDPAAGSKAVSEEILDGDSSGEFPRTDDRYMTRPYRHAYLAGSSGEAMAFDQLLHYDVQSGRCVRWGDGSYLLGEPILAPRGEDADEGEGYLLNLAYNRSTALSELLVLDATDVAAGPLARVMLPLRIPMGFHGSWIGAS
ncbi:MAG: carotenoid oxygenase [Halioglobus sp.]|nr:carotenoid oxygenase [Halioglobus sp.]|tara:strand:- start:2022 stop:3431 length:1410 start_codon:yes stop_codon:yes gene_type:complete